MQPPVTGPAPRLGDRVIPAPTSPSPCPHFEISYIPATKFHVAPISLLEFLLFQRNQHLSTDSGGGTERESSPRQEEP